MSDVQILVSRGGAVTLPSHSDMVCLRQLALPGVVIFVHGVNSDGEWYDAAELGLCAGLNNRTARNESQMAHFSIDAGVMAQASYSPEVTPDGLINPKLDAKSFIKDDPNYSPVIRFRWGYRANAEELKAFGGNVWLNEQNFWGGGPFANGCSSLPDLWTNGLNDELFLWLTAQHLNPAVGRDVYGCPPRAYYVHAAMRLAKLIESIRKKQADVPITIVCHSQGNMVSLAAAFLGDLMPAVTDPWGKSGKPVADSYVLCNPPYSLLETNGTEGWTARKTVNTKGERGRVTYEARCTTLKNLFTIMRGQIGNAQDADKVDDWAGNTAPKDGSPAFKAADDRQKHGFNGHTHGRVTLYCNPHDQVISASPVQGIGWRGVGVNQIGQIGGDGVFSQRVFAQGFEVGKQGVYNYWVNHHDQSAKPGNGKFWHPPSPNARYSITQGLESDQSFVGKVMTLLSAPVFIVMLKLIGALTDKLRINGEPPKDWTIPINAPALEPFLPHSHRHAKMDEEGSTDFDEDMDPMGETRDANKPKDAMNPDDPYDTTPGERKGDQDSEAHQRYEDKARLRMMARRDGLADEQTQQVVGEDSPSQASGDYQSWRKGKIIDFLKEGVNQVATDHSTIMTNPMHAIKALAYDVAVGYSKLGAEDWTDFRIEADWRFVGALAFQGNPNAKFGEYIKSGTLDGKALHEHPDYVEANRPAKIDDSRDNTLAEKIGSVV